MKYLANIKVMNERMNDGYAASQTGEIISFPQNVSVVSTFRCNYRCKVCFQTDFNGELNWKVMDNIEPILPFVQDLHPFGGEPFLYKRIGDFFNLAHEYDCRVKIITNGILIDADMAWNLVAKKIHRLLISIDAGTAATYKYLRGGDYDQLLRNLEAIAREKRLQDSPVPHLEFNFLALRSNIAELPGLVDTAARLGVETINVFYPKILKEELIPECLWFSQGLSDEMMLAAIAKGREAGVAVVPTSLFSDATKIDDAVFRSAQKCTRPWRNLNIDIFGNATLCCFGTPVIGNVQSQDFGAVWNSPLAQKIRETVGTPQEFDFCRTCTVRPFSPKNLEYHMPPDIHRKIPQELLAAGPAR